MPAPTDFTTIAPHARLTLQRGERSITAQLGVEYLPILDSPSVDLTAPIVFVGYGISDPADRFDEYDGVDVRNRVVLFLRGKPEGYSKPLTHVDKERVARAKGAVGFLTATAPVLTTYEARRHAGHAPKALYGRTSGERHLPGAWISTDLAERVISGSETPRGEMSLRALQMQLDRLAPQSRTTAVSAAMQWTSGETAGTLYNVLGFLPAEDSATDGECVILGAHRDHFGRQAGLLFPGADDNASGTAVLLEVARLLAQSEVKPKRSILFVSFSGEEQGLLGSKFYVSRPVLPLSKTRAMINVDHAGVGNGRLTVGVTGRSKEVAQRAAADAGLSGRLDVFGFFPGGDHVPFKEAGVPTLTIVSGGSHPHFHQPDDTADTIDPDILAAVTRYVLALTWQIANE